MHRQAIRWNYMTKGILKELKKYENRWVALRKPNEDVVVGSGDDVSEARRAAEQKGYKDVVLLRVLPFRGGYVPHA